MCLLLHWLSLCFQTVLPPSLPFQQKNIVAFFFLSSFMQIFFCGFMMPCNTGIVRGPSSLPLHCCFQRKGLRQTAGATSLVPPSPETEDGGNHMLEKSSWTLWHGAVRHPNLRHSPKSLNTLHRIGTRPLAVYCKRSHQPLAQRGLDISKHSRTAGNCNSSSRLEWIGARK